jgi:hypothetical protein
MKYFRFRKYIVDAYTTWSIETPPNAKVIYYHDELAGVEIDDAQEILLFQHPECDVTEQTYADVELELKSSFHYASINEIVKKLIKNKYSIEEEISMLKKDKTDAEYLSYEQFVNDCRALGTSMKIEKGLKQ